MGGKKPSAGFKTLSIHLPTIGNGTKHANLFESLKYFDLIGTSIADPGCLSRILIFFHRGSNNNNKERGEQFLVLTFCVAINFNKWKIIFIFEQVLS
jgi:hypothetical protein